MRLIELLEGNAGWPDLYHGSENTFAAYDARKGRPGQLRGDSFVYTTPDPEVAKTYGPRVYQVNPVVPYRVIDISKASDALLDIVTEFQSRYPTSRYAKWPSQRLYQIVLEGRMFVKDEYGNLQKDLLSFLFKSGYTCVILRDNSHGLHANEQSWVFSKPADVKLDLIEAIITERRIQNTEIMYHGTTDKYIRSILKQGLLANPPVRTYSGVDDMEDGYKTFGGVYLANNKRKAISAARDAVFKFGGQPLL